MNECPHWLFNFYFVHLIACCIYFPILFEFYSSHFLFYFVDLLSTSCLCLFWTFFCPCVLKVCIFPSLFRRLVSCVFCTFASSSWLCFSLFCFVAILFSLAFRILFLKKINTVFNKWEELKPSAIRFSVVLEFIWNLSWNHRVSYWTWHGERVKRRVSAEASISQTF